MQVVIFINEKGEKVEKEFLSFYLYEKFLNRCKHSKKIKLVYYGGK